MFAMAEPGRLRALLEEGGFTEVEVEAVDVVVERADPDRYLEETTDLSRPFAEVRERLSEPDWRAVADRVRELVQPFSGPDGSLRIPGSSLVASASA
jgi:hypothetical protein